MKLTAHRKDLVHALERAAAVADKRATVPILSNALLVANETSLTVQAMDLFLSAKTVIEVECDAAESICCSAHALLDRVKNMPGETVTLQTKDAALTVSSKGSSRRYTIQTVDADGFPKLPQRDPEATVYSIKSSLLATLLDSTAHAISTDDSRLALNSALVEIRPGAVTVVATDGHRVSVARGSDDNMEATRDLLVPARGVHQIKKLCDGTDRALSLSVNGSSLVLEDGPETLTVKLTDAQFPPYEQVIPKYHNGARTVNRDSLIGAARAVGVASGHNGGIEIAVEAGTIQLSAQDPETGESHDQVTCLDSGTITAHFGISGKYLLNALGALSSELVRIEFSGELDPIVIREHEPSDGFSSTHVVMPMRLS